MVSTMDMLGLHAREKLGQSDSWHAYCFEVKDSPYGDFYEITGVVAPLISRGTNKGKPNWKAKDSSTQRTAQIGKDEHKTWVEDWEKRTQTCAVCRNTGREAIGWSQDEGTKYRPCSRCGRNGSEIQGQLPLVTV